MFSLNSNYKLNWLLELEAEDLWLQKMSYFRCSESQAVEAIKQVILLLQALPHWAESFSWGLSFKGKFWRNSIHFEECLSLYRVVRKRQTPQGTSQNNKNSQQQQQENAPQTNNKPTTKAKQEMIFFVVIIRFSRTLIFQKEPYQNSLPRKWNNKNKKDENSYSSIITGITIMS